jgi:Nuclease-related domain
LRQRPCYCGDYLTAHAALGVSQEETRERLSEPGAVGERRTAGLLALLERQGWAVLHDLAIPGSAANIDHLVIGPGGGW